MTAVNAALMQSVTPALIPASAQLLFGVLVPERGRGTLTDGFVMGWLKNWRRRRMLARHRLDPALWWRVTEQLAFLHGLDPAQTRRLEDLTLLFLAEKEFAPAGGIELSDAMCLAIAVQACLPILELGLDWYRGWRGVVVYPGGFRVPRSKLDTAGVLHEWDAELAGESWLGGPVVLSWDAVSAAGRNSTDHHAKEVSVVIHEFAHKLDMVNGRADGLPPLHPGMDRRAWREAFTSAYVTLCDEVERGRQTWLDPYAAESPAEFFAVASEAFFEEPNETQRHYSAVYEQLHQFYRQDPARRLSA